MDKYVTCTVPTECNRCCSLNIQCKYKEYPEDKARVPGFVWSCNDCGASVGCHPNTKIPLGKMADVNTRRLRKRLHEVLDPLWHEHIISRPQAYQLLADILGIASPEGVHVSHLSIDQLKKCIEEVRRFYSERRHLADDRRNKRQDRAKKKQHRIMKNELTHIRLRKSKF